MKKRPVGESFDKSKFVPQRDKIKNELHIQEKFDLTPKQRIILETALHKDTRCIFIDGVYGSTKSYLSVLAALKLINQKRLSGIIYVRNPIESSSTGKIGFTPGSVEDKMSAYGVPLMDKLGELLPKAEIDLLIKEKRIEVLPLGHIRGHSWTCQAVILDEAACMSWDDLILALSRCGNFVRLFVIGDSKNQNDIGSKSGFARMFNCFEDDESKKNGIFTFRLQEKSDILRSEFVKFVMEKLRII